jgi:general secretion pathway protein E
MGVEPFLLSSSMLGILAQRLVRCLCTVCREAYAPSPAELALLEGATPAMLYRPVGCPACTHTGYHRRTGIYELLRVDDGLRRLIHDRVGEQELREYALKHGMHSLRQDGLRLVISGTTSLEELLRVTRD